MSVTMVRQIDRGKHAFEKDAHNTTVTVLPEEDARVLSEVPCYVSCSNPRSHAQVAEKVADREG